ncbi:hypothetical protein LOK49_LG10G02168 [Camellia lanceoleosa]|uniref:Uncharacterized protein n=1 Tax=Camellia lanceoleosa TaxID=1840588 RepID=A0ACC0G7I8_9ERIC|nr:hypothetical protein LOK49_LG10G02168 [Camellia lanceoleosa]
MYLDFDEGVSNEGTYGKQKRNNRKVKDKGRDDKSGVAIQDILQEESLADERKDFTIEDAELVLENSDVSDSLDCLHEMRLIRRGYGHIEFILPRGR